MAATDFAFKEGLGILSPKDLVQLRRPGDGVANPAGDLVFVTVSQYSLAEKTNTRSIHIVPVETNIAPADIPFTNSGENFWLDDRTLAHVVTEGDEKGEVVKLYAISIKVETVGSASFTLSDPPVLVGKFPTDTANNFRYSTKACTLVFSDLVHADGDLMKVKKNDEEWENRGSSAIIYDETYERHWDTWVGPKRFSLFSVQLAKEEDDKWALGTDFINLLKGTGHHAPVEPFGGINDFDVSETHVIYTTKDPKLPKAMHTKQDIFVVSIHGQSAARELTYGEHGATHNPIFNATGDKAAWIQRARDEHEADRAKIVIYDLKQDVRYILAQHWDRSVSSIAFAHDGSTIFFTAADFGRIKVFSLPVPRASTTNPEFDPELSTPCELTSAGTATHIQPRPNGCLIFTCSSFTSPKDVFVMRGLDGVIEIDQLTALAASGLRGKVLDKGSEVWFEGAEGKTVHGWVLKPPGFKESDRKKWPIALHIHGGPEHAWYDEWWDTWNLNIFAQQGYVVVAINPTGSTSYGQEFTDAIKDDWGGKPFVDLQKGWKYVLDSFPQVDPERAVGAGASYGGYAINWIQGHPEFGFNLRGLVCHDGIFSAGYFGYSTDELFYSNYEWGGRPWEPGAREIINKFDPMNFVEKWSTPMLVIHGSKDYRVPETEGIAAFHALQQLGVPSRLVIFPDENHWVFKHENSVMWYDEVCRWFAKYSQ